MCPHKRMELLFVPDKGSHELKHFFVARLIVCLHHKRHKSIKICFMRCKPNKSRYICLKYLSRCLLLLRLSLHLGCRWIDNLHGVANLAEMNSQIKVSISQHWLVGDNEAPVKVVNGPRDIAVYCVDVNTHF